MATVIVEVDGTRHDLLEGGVNTACGLDVPYGSPYWSHDYPTDKLCGDCFPETKKKTAAKKNG